MRGTVDNYLVYLITGVIPWTFFTDGNSQGMASIKEVNAGIIKKVYFPREILPLSVVSAGIINFFISCVIILVFCAIFAVGFFLAFAAAADCSTAAVSDLFRIDISV